ncbi:MAG: hypothetical protein LUD47_02320 [Clostridia bacterium]|nr:hypothetical protein [Clostridia bacterium]
MTYYDRPKKITEDTKTPQRRARKFGKNLLMSLIWPVVCIVIAQILASAAGRQLFATGVSVRTFFRGLLMVLIAMWALNTNLNSGRMDFSLGATGIIAAVCAVVTMGGSITTTQEVIAFMFLCMIYGTIFGLVGGAVFILLKLPPVVTSLGMCLVYEGIAKIIVGNNNTFSFTSSATTGQFVTQPAVLVILTVAVLAVMSLIICYSRFGYNKNALIYNQKISVETGIHEIPSCLFCYALAGLLIGLYQFMNTTQLGNVAISVNLGTSTSVFKNFLPIFVGGLLAKYSNQLIGSFMAAIGTQFLAQGMDRASALGFSSNIQTLITSFLIFFVLVYMVDKYAFINWVKMRLYLRKQKRLGLIQKKKKEEISR